MNIIIPLTEEDGGFFYNTAALIGRDGKISGKYRKVHLPVGEQESGYCSGESFPVFETDFGRIGILICFDFEHIEAGRVLRKNGAEIIFVPTIGNYLLQSQMYAKWNGVYVVVAGSDRGPSPSRIISPNGEIIADLDDGSDGIAFAEIDLNEGCYKQGTGFWPAESDAKVSLIKKRREDLY